MTSYRIETRASKYTDGTPCYIASHPEIPDCAIGYGPTKETAEARLAIAREHYFASSFRTVFESTRALSAATRTIPTAGQLIAC